MSEIYPYIASENLKKPQNPEHWPQKVDRQKWFSITYKLLPDYNIWINWICSWKVENMNMSPLREKMISVTGKNYSQLPIGQQGKNLLIGSISTSKEKEFCFFSKASHMHQL